jgi:hypothetical protein
MAFGKIKIEATIFMLIIFLIGLTITVYSYKIAGTVVDCSINAQNAVRGLLVMGTALICIPITILAFNCPLPLESGKDSIMSNVFILLLLLINSSIIGLSSVIHNECEASREYTKILIPLSVLATSFSLGYLVYEVYRAFAKGKGKSSSKSIEMVKLPQPQTHSDSPSDSPSGSETSSNSEPKTRGG